MKLLLPALAFLSIACAMSASQTPGRLTILVGGDSHGYLSPCGCTKPMSGGIRRRATAIRNMTVGRPALILENGGLAHGIGRQDELKAEALAESMKSLGVDAVNVGATEAALGKGMLESIARLSGNHLVSGSVEGEGLPFRSMVVSEGFAVGGVTTKGGEAARDLGGRAFLIDDAVEALIQGAGKRPVVLMLEGPESEARRIAQAYPSIALIVYSSLGDPPSQPIVVGKTWLTTPGEKGKSVVRFTFANGAFSGYGVAKLGPEVPNDPAAERIFQRYLGRLRNEKLLEKLPRTTGAKLAGNPTCGTCHIEAMGAWEKTRHSGALATLEEVGQDRDPDCVGCHVVELGSDKGYQSRALTPQFTDVGCESCHGAGGEHALNPSIRLGEAGKASCLPCHNREHSPEFDFNRYWDKIKH